MDLEPLLIVVKLKPRSCLGKFKTLESKIIWQRIWHSIPKQIKRLIHRHWPWHIHHSYDHAYNFELDIGHRSSTFWPISSTRPCKSLAMARLPLLWQPSGHFCTNLNCDVSLKYNLCLEPLFSWLEWASLHWLSIMLYNNWKWIWIIQF